MSQYIDGFVLPVPKDKLEAYKAAATKAAAIWKDHGALEYRECVGDDLEIADQVPFTKLAGAQPDEHVIFAYAVYPSRQVRDEANKKLMEDPRMKELCQETEGLFDYKRMAYGGFRTLLYK